MTKYRVIIDNTEIEFSDQALALDLKNSTEGAILEEFEYNPSIETRVIVPREVKSWRIKSILKLMNLDTSVEQALELLEEPTKTVAKMAWVNGSDVERGSGTVAFLKAALELTDAQVDDIFIQADAIIV